MRVSRFEFLAERYDCITPFGLCHMPVCLSSTTCVSCDKMAKAKIMRFTKTVQFLSSVLGTFD